MQRLAVSIVLCAILMPVAAAAGGTAEKVAMPSPEQLAALVAIADHGSFSAAARALYDRVAASDWTGAAVAVAEGRVYLEGL